MSYQNSSGQHLSRKNTLEKIAGTIYVRTKSFRTKSVQTKFDRSKVILAKTVEQNQ
jgi:hypothetical protein